MIIQGITPLNTAVTVSLYLGLSLSAFLLIRQSSKSQTNIFLGLIILCYLPHVLQAYLYGARLLESFPHLIRSGPLFRMAIGPLILFYVLACTQKGFKFRKYHLFHLIPWVLELIYNIPFLMLDGATKYQMFLEFVENGNLGIPLIINSIAALHTTVYFILAGVVILRYRKHINETSSFIDLAYHRWLLLFSSILLVPIVVAIAFVVGLGNWHIQVIFYAIAFLFIAIYTAILLKPQIFHKFPNQVEVVTVEEQEKQKYESSNLQESQKNKLVEKLLQYVEAEKPYQEPELTLGELSERLNIPTHYLSQIINEKIQQSFLEFINSYRIKAAKEMLISDKFDHYTILAIAFEAGFNSKTAFYTAFKKFTNMTPSKYRKSFKNSDLDKKSA